MDSVINNNSNHNNNINGEGTTLRSLINSCTNTSNEQLIVNNVNKNSNIINNININNAPSPISTCINVNKIELRGSSNGIFLNSNKIKVPLSNSPLEQQDGADEQQHQQQQDQKPLQQPFLSDRSILFSSGDKEFLNHGSNNIITDQDTLLYQLQQKEKEKEKEKDNDEIMNHDDIIGYNEENEDNFFNEGMDPIFAHSSEHHHNEFDTQEDEDSSDESSDESENIDEVLVYTEDIESEKEKKRERLITSPPSFDPHTLYSMSQSLLNCSLNSNNNNNNISSPSTSSSINNSSNNINLNNSSNNNVNSNNNQEEDLSNINSSNNNNSNNNNNFISQPLFNPLSTSNEQYELLPNPTTTATATATITNLPPTLPSYPSSSSIKSLKNSFGSNSITSSGELNNIFSSSMSPPMSPPNRNIRSLTFPGTNPTNCINTSVINSVTATTNPTCINHHHNHHNNGHIRKSADDTVTLSPTLSSGSSTSSSNPHHPNHNQQKGLNNKTLERLSCTRKEIYELIEKKESLIEKQNLIDEGYSENADSFENLAEEIQKINEKIVELENLITNLSNSNSNWSLTGSSTSTVSCNPLSPRSMNPSSSTSSTSSNLTNSLRKFSQELKIELRPLDLRAELYSSINTSPRGSASVSGSNGFKTSSNSCRNSPIPFFENENESIDSYEKKNEEQFESLVRLIQENQLYTKPIEFKEIKLLEKLDSNSKSNNIWQIEYKSTQLVLKQPKDQESDKNIEKRKQLFNGSNASGSNNSGNSNNSNSNGSNSEIIPSKYTMIQHKNLGLLVGWCGDSIIYESFKGMSSLHDLIHRDGLKIDMPLFIKISKDIASVMGLLHSKDVAHGNLTSRSIYLDRFQIVKVSFPRLNATDLNNPAIEPRYMAPEMTRMEEDQISCSIDVYAYAFVLWEALTSHLPFRKFNDISVAAKVAYENLRPKIPTSCPLIIRKLINRCWAPLPSDRPTFNDILKLFDHLEGKLFFSSPGILWSLNNDQEVERELQKKERFNEITEFLRGKKEIKFDEVAIVEKVGAGSFANVFLGIWNGYKVAIKILKNESISNDEKFIKEVSSLIKSHHPNVVTFMGACIDPPCIFTEYLQGGSLYDVLHVQKIKLNPLMMYKMIHDLSLGMEHLHSIQMLHRDLTSKNILLDEFKNIKIADFGLATTLSDDMTLSGITNPRWRSPELTKGLVYNEKVDVYSFGLVVYEIYTGKIPFEGLDGTASAAKAAFENYRPSIPPDCPVSLRKLITKCWAADPSQRPSFTEILAELETMKSKFIRQLSFLNDLIQNPDDDNNNNLNYDEEVDS
ncbi:hypothetical protein ACTFIU_003027 [Dictyostelium citrinum]